jgi:hypothetical protein
MSRDIKPPDVFSLTAPHPVYCAYAVVAGQDNTPLANLWRTTPKTLLSAHLLCNNPLPMHLLQVDALGQFSLVEKYGEQIPPYGILSHTWLATHEEVTFKDVMKGKGKEKRGYEKLRFCAEQATHDKLDYFWIDTCCIDKSSSAELQEAINSMFKWYRDSARCYVYLQDVSQITPDTSSTGYGWRSAFRRSRWFTRGWTLQELLAPTSVNFFTLEGARLGDKHSLCEDISEATNISPQVIHGNVYSLSQLPINTRLGWARSRQTTREEDKCYSLLGLFNVHMSLLYGEGRAKAFRRFHEELKKEREDPTELNAILAQVTAQQIENNADKSVMLDYEMDSMPLKRSATVAFQGTDYDDPSDRSRQSLRSKVDVRHIEGPSHSCRHTNYANHRASF